METQPASDKRKLLTKLALVCLVLLVAGVAVIAGLDVKALIRQGTEIINQAGPAVFFAAMTILPAMGVPILTFVLPVGGIFAERLGMPLVIGLSLVAITINFLLAYALSRWILRPWLTRLIATLGYKIPEVEGSDAKDLIVILRVTPGIPFCVQNYMSGLAKVPFVPYLVISCIVTYAYNTAFILFGDALLHGKGGLAMTALGLLVAVVAGTHMVRKHYAAKKRGASA